MSSVKAKCLAMSFSLSQCPTPLIRRNSRIRGNSQILAEAKMDLPVGIIVAILDQISQQVILLCGIAGIEYLVGQI